ncbi:MAG: hypothetical protein KA473_01705 [Anaerolineales bacterium]|nr:hypothetical protein [Anaerolineales bacterium]MBP6208119.1 hypothetical protein [Anaerolineales bacterium]
MKTTKASADLSDFPTIKSVIVVSVPFARENLHLVILKPKPKTQSLYLRIQLSDNGAYFILTL